MRKLELNDLGILNLILELDPALAEQIVGAVDRVRNTLRYPPPAPLPPQVAPMPQVEYRRPGSAPPPLEDQIVTVFRSLNPGAYTKAEIAAHCCQMPGALMSEQEFETAFARAQTQGKITINGKRGPGAKYTVTA